MSEINYTTPEAQVEKLISQNLIVQNKEYAIQQLKTCGYSNMIKSYREPYMIQSDGRKVYRHGITFEQIESLYTLDKNLRNAVMSAMQDLEEHVKEAAADVVASSFGTHQDDYLKFRNYRDKSKKHYRFSLAGILSKMKETLETDKDPIAHYAKEHGIVPPWILFKSIYFSTIINFVHQFKPAEQEKMVSHLYDTTLINVPASEWTKFMMASLFMCLDYRNMAAHGGRIYNYEPTSHYIHKLDTSLHGFSTLVLALGTLKYKAPFNILDKALTSELTRHCSKFPEDVTYLSNILNLDIHIEDFVWISKNSNRYHTNPHCSGMVNAIKFPLATAQTDGYIPCKRCR